MKLKNFAPKTIKRLIGHFKIIGITIFVISKQTFIETIESLKYRKLFLEAPDVLEGYIRKEAHILEKEIKNLFVDKEPPFDHKGAYNNLKKALERWKKEGLRKTETIKWSEKILKEYEKHSQSGWVCPYIGTPEEKDDSINILSFLKQRRSIRVWKDEPLDYSEIIKLIDAARWAPSSCNRQPLHFLVINKKELIWKITKTIRGGTPFFSKAPVFIIVLVDARNYNLPQEKYTIYQDAAAAIQNMLLMAHNIGIGACWASYVSDSGVIINEREVRTELDIPRYFKIAGLVAVGRSNERVCVIPRKEIEKLISFNKMKK